MSTVEFKIGIIANEPRIAEMTACYRRELVRRKMPTNWPESNLYHFAALFYNEEAMSMLLYAPIYADRKIYSIGAYTRPSWRRLGIYDFIWNACVNRWRKEDAFDVFQSGFHKNNLISQKMQEKQGRYIFDETETHQRTRFSLKPTGDEYEMTIDHLKPMVDLFTRLSG